MIDTTEIRLMNRREYSDFKRIKVVLTKSNNTNGLGFYQNGPERIKDKKRTVSQLNRFTITPKVTSPWEYDNSQELLLSVWVR